MEERRVLYHMLREGFDLSRTGLLNLLQATAGEGWRQYAEQTVELDEKLKHMFLKELRSQIKLVRELRDVDEMFHIHRKNVPWEENDRRYRLISDLRRLLAHVCISALEPDLIILDEFQRFKELLHGESEAALLAQALFDYCATDSDGRDRLPRVLLLSATPYKMYTLNRETEDDHYNDFLNTLKFLFQDNEAVAEVERNLERFRQALHGGTQCTHAETEAARNRLQDQFRQVMVRTERVGATERRDAMLSEPTVQVEMRPQDLKQGVLVDQAARTLKIPDSIEYWKSGPYLQNLMKGYALKRAINEQSESASEKFMDLLVKGTEQLLRRSHFERYRELEPANARLRALLQDTVGAEHWKLLWVPPSLPYWQPYGAYADQERMTKSLVFSSWQVVPDAIASLCSYEAERRMLEGDPDRPRYDALTRERKPLLRFSSDAEERLSGMPVLCLTYPCATLTREIDPLGLALNSKSEGPKIPSLDDIKRTAKERIERLLRATGRWPGNAEGREDQKWYWAALAVLDAHYAPWMHGWCLSSDDDGWRRVNREGEEEPASGFTNHVSRFAEHFAATVELGRPPQDLPEVLTEIALAGPAVCAMRAMHRVVGWAEWDQAALGKAAALVGEGFRSLFNLPETISFLRGSNAETPYWRMALEYGLAGNLAAVLDEYFHWLREALGLADQDPLEALKQLGGTAQEAVSVHTSRIQLDQFKIRPRRGSFSLDPFNLRSRFAMRFGDLRSDQDEKLARTETVQKAFNSPFRPFILATTSIGQEGLDFHPYCHAVYHWNLPSNPVELEQREGRVHRYKGYAIRKNVAAHIGLDKLRNVYAPGCDPWRRMFELAVSERAPGKGDLIPYWIYPLQNGATVERRVPMLPFSREQQRLPDLKASLAVYRLVFGQPRQEDLLFHLKERDSNALASWRFDLSPPAIEAEAIDGPPSASQPPEPDKIVCRRCGDEVGHVCGAERNGKAAEVHWRPGDDVMMFYKAEKSRGAEFVSGEVIHVNDDWAEVRFDGADRELRFRQLRFRGGDLFWDQVLAEHCRLVSHFDPSGSEEIALICPQCGTHRLHRCTSAGSSTVPFQAGARIHVTYHAHPGLDAGTLPAFVVRTSGRVARVHFTYDTEAAHLYQCPNGTWRDLDYGVPCSVAVEGQTSANAARL
jgi:Helicase conserved C-terminal domain